MVHHRVGWHAEVQGFAGGEFAPLGGFYGEQLGGAGIDHQARMVAQEEDGVHLAGDPTLAGGHDLRSPPAGTAVPRAAGAPGQAGAARQ